jgi:hypothetical protein
VEYALIDERIKALGGWRGRRSRDALEDPSGEGGKVDEAALKDLIRAAVALNLMKKPRAGRL